MGGWMGVEWVAGLNENITNSAKLGLTGAEFGNKLTLRGLHSLDISQAFIRIIFNVFK